MNGRDLASVMLAIIIATGVEIAVIFVAATAVLTLLSRNMELYVKRAEIGLERNLHVLEKNNLLLEWIKANSAGKGPSL